MKLTGERRARRLVRRRSGGWCEMCDKAVAREWHHRINRSQGGPWCPANGLHLCAACHLHVTLHPRAAREQGWSLLPEQIPERCGVWLARRGWSLLSPAGDVTPLDPSDPYAHPW